MPLLFGKNYSKKELLEKVGDISQIGGVQRFKMAEGRQEGVAAVEFRTGSGFNFLVVPGKGMDISTAEYRGVPLAFRTPAGEVSPEFYVETGLEWLRSFMAGLLTTCGLTYVGAPCEDEGKPLGLHGRINNTPAFNVCVEAGWEGERYLMSVSGTLREYSFFGENLILKRKISAELGAKKLWIDDEVINQGTTLTPHMILYHINAGFPVVSEGSILVATTKKATPRNKEAEKDKEHFYLNEAPVLGYQERCYSHEMVSVPEDGFVYSGLVNKALPDGRPIGFYVKYRKEELPNFTQWKMNGVQEYVVGMEPANCEVEGREKERKRGTLQFLKPGEKREYHLEIGVLSTAEEVARFETLVKSAFSR